MKQLLAMFCVYAWYSVSARAALVTGNITFSGNAVLNAPPAQALLVSTWLNGSVQSRTATFAQIPIGTALSKLPPRWSWNSVGHDDFWIIGGFHFETLYSSLMGQGGSTMNENGYVRTAGKGVITGNGFTPTVCSWTFSAQEPEIFSYYAYTMTITSLNSNGTPVLTMTNMGNSVVLKWTDANYTLQSASTLNGTFVNVAGAVSPYTNSTNGKQQFFRLLQ